MRWFESHEGEHALHAEGCSQEMLQLCVQQAVDNLGGSHVCGQLLQAVVYGQCATGRDPVNFPYCRAIKCSGRNEEGLGCVGRCPTTCAFSSKLVELPPGYWHMARR